MVMTLLIYFEGCPNVERARAAIRSAGVTVFSEMKQDQLPQENLYRRFSSPTILVDGIIIVGSENGAAACSLVDWGAVSSKIRSHL